MTDKTSRLQRPLCVDLDGTLISTDLLFEHVLVILKRSPWILFALPFWALKGPLYLKKKLAELSPTNPQVQFRESVLSYLKEEKSRGRKLYLATASPKIWADQINEASGHLFEEVFATSDGVNLKGSRKAQLLSERFGENFTYMADAAVDKLVFRAPCQALPVGSDRFIKSVEKEFPVEASIHASTDSVAHILKALRPHQWAKNLLVFLPVFLAHKVTLENLGLATLAFFSFSLMASSIYIVNDLLDLESDRLHPKKCRRPIAQGLVQIPTAVAVSLILLVLSLGLGALLPPDFYVVLVTYLIATTLYSFSLKSKLLLDVVVLTGLFTLRIYSGSVATRIPISEWLLAFSLFTFFSLALVKRYVEIRRMKRTEKSDVSGRAYQVQDEPVVIAIGAASGFIATLVLTLYLNQAAAANLYAHPKWLLGISILMMYWISRIWILAHRGQVDDDPIVFALKDGQSLAVGILTVFIMWIAAV